MSLKDDLDTKFAKDVIEGNLPFSVFEMNSNLRLAVQELSLGAYSLPSANLLANKLLYQLVKTVDDRIRRTNDVKSTADRDKYLVFETVSFDGGKDYDRREVYVTALQTADFDTVLGLIDVSSIRHDAENIAGLVEANLMEYGRTLAASPTIIGCVTDTPSTMAKVKKLIRERSKSRIQPLNCCLHVFSLATKDILSYGNHLEVLKGANKETK